MPRTPLSSAPGARRFCRTEARNRSLQTWKVEITSTSYRQVGFDLIDSDHNVCRHIARDSNAPGFAAMMEIAAGLRRTSSPGELTAPPIGTVPFESEVKAYARVAEGRV